jgi:hypothetical protein
METDVDVDNPAYGGELDLRRREFRDSLRVIECHVNEDLWDDSDDEED